MRSYVGSVENLQQLAFPFPGPQITMPPPTVVDRLKKEVLSAQLVLLLLLVAVVK